MPKEYVRYGRLGLILLTTAGFLLLSFYVKSWTEHNVFPFCFPL